MKKHLLRISFLFLSATLLLASCHRGTNDWDQFKEKYASMGTTIRLNGLMKLGLAAALKNEDDPDTRNLLNILRKMKGVEIHIIPESWSFTSADVVRLSQVLDKSSYESLISVQKGDQMVNLWALGGKDVFKDPLALIHSGTEVVMVEMKGTLTADDIQTLANAGRKYTDKL